MQLHQVGVAVGTAAQQAHLPPGHRQHLGAASMEQDQAHLVPLRLQAHMGWLANLRPSS